MAFAAEKREHPAQARACGGILLCLGRSQEDAGWRRDRDDPALWGNPSWAISFRQIFNDSDSEVLWLIVGAPDKEFEAGKIDMKLIYPVEPTQLPSELKGVEWPQKS